MVCLRFHTVAFQILKPRLQAAALRDDLQLHLLCTPPGTESPVLCHYLGTDVPPDSQISGLYTRFRPEAYPPKRIPLIPPAKLIMCILGTDDFRLSDFRSIEGKSQGPTVRRIVLEDFDHFFQLQTKVDLALSHGKPYIVPSFNIHQSLLRVRREWLEEQTGSKIIWIDTQQGIGLRVLPRAKGTGQPPNIDFDLDIEGG
ncbi:F-box domain protein [Penicillium capsulatum]|uniref:F-box domain protein n=1 Tax=Penicillium capsulatum TaxID=69766 RepID=A0A9W9I9G9_9EURO|nr:F-box domain protein [Penicillium capsulatum]KAJ6135524.1 F-box domain protein [Penicillium capsulatum]